MDTRTITIELPEDAAARIETREGESLAQKIEGYIAECLAAETHLEADQIANLSPQQIAALEREAEAALASGIASANDVANAYARFGVKWAG
jgi:hypothetical protein